jgi:endonuclease III related protein
MAHYSIAAVYDRLYQHYGPQQWWPADSAFEVIVGAVLTQNTAWVNVERAIDNLKHAKALDARIILQTPIKRLAQWLKPSGYFNIKAKRLKHVCRWYVSHGEYATLRQWETGKLRESLLAVHGIGKETADAILLYAFDRPVFVIDAYTRRLLRRLGSIHGDESYDDLQRSIERGLARRRDKSRLFNEYHALIVRHAKHSCAAKPRCETCVLQRGCAKK